MEVTNTAKMLLSAIVVGAAALIIAVAALSFIGRKSTVMSRLVLSRDVMVAIAAMGFALMVIPESIDEINLSVPGPIRRLPGIRRFY